MAHLTQGLSLLSALPGTPERARLELDLAVVLAPSLLITMAEGLALALLAAFSVQYFLRYSAAPGAVLWVFC